VDKSERKGARLLLRAGGYRFRTFRPLGEATPIACPACKSILSALEAEDPFTILNRHRSSCPVRKKLLSLLRDGHFEPHLSRNSY
jgi:hypothetical protein